MNEKTPIVVVCAVIRSEAGVLVAQRPLTKHLGGYWEFPGGKIEDQESAEAALHREIREELGCEIVINTPGPSVQWDHEKGSILMHSFLCRLQDSSPEPIALEHTSLAWHTVAELRELNLAPADWPIVDWLETL